MNDLRPLLKLPRNVEDLGKLIVAKGLKSCPKLKKIAQSGHTATYLACLRDLAKILVALMQRNEA